MSPKCAPVTYISNTSWAAVSSSEDKVNRDDWLWASGIDYDQQAYGLFGIYLYYINKDADFHICSLLTNNSSA